MSYLGVYQAVFGYAAATPDELTIEEKDILYIIEKSTTDEWWKVKKRIVGTDVEEPVGLVPKTYIEPAPVIGTANALYDYTKQTDEEISFSEGEQFQVYDTSDVDWILVSKGQEYGFIPANYVEVSGSNKALPAAPVVTETNVLQVSRRDTRSSYNSNRSYEEEERPPQKPKRPTNGKKRETVSNDSVPRIDDDFDDSKYRAQASGIFTWNVAEVEGKKKKKVTLGIGGGKVYLNPDNSSGDSPRNWKAENLVSFSAEKKHVFLDFKSPSASIELHVGSKDTAREILGLLGDISGAVSASALDEIKAASKPTANGFKTGQMMFDFLAQNRDELNCKEGDLVYVVNEKKSPDWWLVENIDTGKRGVVPSTYVNTGSETSGYGAQKSSKSSKKREDRRRDERDRERERERDHDRERERTREKRRSDDRKKEKSGSSKSKSKPNPNKIRTWVDKSGSFRVEAEFLGCVDGKIHLHKYNGVKIAVAAEKLCAADLDYVEKVTGTSLDKYRSKRKERSRSREKERRRERPSKSSKKDDYDWFEFFLNCGVDLNQCQRYTLNFEREQMDEGSLEDLNAGLMRSLGLREGDIIRCMKFLNDKFGRSDTSDGQKPAAEPALAPKIDSKNLHNLDDDAWTIKPSAAQTETKREVKSPPVPQKPQINGSLQDLVDLKPLDANYTANPLKDLTAVPAIQPTKTGSSITLGQQKTGTSMAAQKTGSSLRLQRTGGLQPLDPFKTGGHNILPVTTGAPFILPYATGGASVIVPVQTMQPVIIGQPTTTFATTTGSMLPLQPIRTGGITAIQTGGGLSTVITGGGYVSNSMPVTSFSTGVQQQPVLLNNATGGIQAFQPQSTFGQQITGGAPQGFQNSFPAQNALGQQFTQNAFGQQVTGGAQNTFGQQFTGGAQNTFGQQFTGGATSFNTGGQPFGQVAPQTTFGASPVDNMTNAFQNTSIQQPGLQQGISSLDMLKNMQQQQQLQQQQQQQLQQQQLQQQQLQQQQLQQQQLQQQQQQAQQVPQQFTNPLFNQPQQPYQNNLFAQSQPLPQTTFSPTLTSQPTGFGFGNAPNASFGNSFGVQPQPTGKGASLANATPDNPFGF